MKTRNYYRPSTASLGRKKRVVRRKLGARFFLKFFCLLALLGSVLAGIWLIVPSFFRLVSEAEIPHWRVKKIAVSGVDGELNKKLLLLAQSYQQKPFSVQDAQTLRQDVSRSYPMLKNVSVKRGLLSGRLTLNALHRVPLAKFVLADGKIKYIDADSTIYEDHQPDLLSPVPVIELKGTVPERLGTEYIELIESALQLKQELKFSVLQLDLTSNTVTMRMPDDSIIDFGSAYHLKQKAARAAQVMALARRKYPAPFRLNFQFFDDGKIFLVPLSR